MSIGNKTLENQSAECPRTFIPGMDALWAVDDASLLGTHSHNNDDNDDHNDADGAKHAHGPHRATKGVGGKGNRCHDAWREDGSCPIIMALGSPES